MADLERLAPASGFLFGAVSIADISVAVFFQNLRWARVTPAVDRWPRTLGWVARSEEVPALAKITRIAERLAQTPVPEHRSVAAKLGLPLTEATVAAAAPRRGPMTIPFP
jgi:glutathione S-transferase